MEKNALYKKSGILHRGGRGILRFFADNLGTIIALVVISAVLALLKPVFLSEDNLFTVLRQVSTNAYLALGMTLVIIIGGIDLSVGAIVALVGTVSVGLVANAGVPPVLAILMGMALGTAVGVFNGVVIACTRIPAFIVTMAVMNICRGAVNVYTNGRSIRMPEEGFTGLGTGYLGPIPLPVIYMVAFIVIVTLVLNRSKFGTYVYALGGNRDAAHFSGIPNTKVEISVYAISGFMAAFSGIVLAARMSSGQPSVAEGFELDAIAASVLGGVSMSGGVGKIGGTIIGVLIIGVINNGLTLLNVNSFWQLIIKGVVILIAVYADMLKKQKK